jgi:hypothetical protein
MEKVIKVEQGGLPLVVCVEPPESLEFTHEPCERGPGDIGREALVIVAAAIVDHFCRSAELLATRLGEAGLACGSLPFPFVLPCLKARLAAVAAIWREVAQQADHDAPGNGSAECVVEHRPELSEICNTFGSRRLGNAAAGIPAGKVSDSL